VLVAGQSPADAYAKATYELRQPRVALYEPHTANMDTGWTQWLLDYFRVPFTLVKNDEIRKGKLRDRYDTILLASQSASSILHGIRDGESSGRGRVGGPTAVQQRPEYAGGITLAGLAAIDEFVRSGGTLITFDAASELPVQFFPLPVSARLRSGGDGDDEGASGFYSPGSLLRMTVDPSHPIAFGMPKDGVLFTSGGQAWDISLLPDFNKGDREIKSVVRYAGKDLLASGWVSGERAVMGKSALIHARHGQGQVVLFGFRPQFRGQSFATFKLILNSIYWSAARKL